VSLAAFILFAFLSFVLPGGAFASGQGRDVAAIGVLIDPREPTAGEASAVGITVVNLGNARLQGVPVKLLVNGSQVGPTRYVDLDAGSAIAVLFDWTPPQTGSYSLVGEVGPVQGESEQANNRASLTVTVKELPGMAESTGATGGTGAAAGSSGSGGAIPVSRLGDAAATVARIADQTVPAEVPGRDLAVAGISISPREPLPGEVCRVTLVVANRGTSVLRDIPVRLLVGGSEVGSANVEQLGRGERTVVVFEWIPENFGYHSLIGVAGPVEGEEKNQVNNFASAIVGIPLIKTIHIQDQAITSSKLADAAVVTSKIAALAVTAEKIAGQAVTREKIAENAVDASRLALDEHSLYRVSGGFSYLVPASPGRDFTQRGGLVAVDQATRSIYFKIREPTADNYNVDLSHGLNLYFNWAGVNRLTFRPDGSIDYSGGLYQGGVRGIPTADIRDRAITSDKIALENVLSEHIAPGAVTASELADNAVTESKIAENAVTNRQMADNSISGAKLIDLSVAGNKIADATITAAKLSFNPNKFLHVADNTGRVMFSAQSVDDVIQFAGGGATTVSFDPTRKRVTISSAPGVTSIRAENGLTASPNPITGTGCIGIAPGGVTGSHIQDGAITLAKLASEVEGRLLGPNRVTSTHIQDGTITNADIAGSAVFVSVRDAAGTEKFAVTNQDRRLGFQGTGAVSVSFDPTTHRVTIHAEPAVYNYYYYGPRLYNVPGQPRVEYMGAGEGLEQYKVGDVGYYKIADGGVTESKLADAAVTSVKIKDREVRIEDLREFKEIYYIAPYTYISFWLDDSQPVVWGQREPWHFDALSDFATLMTWDVWYFCNRTGEGKRVAFRGISSSSSSPYFRGSFYIMYDTENGWIRAVGKSDEPIGAGPPQMGCAYYSIENHPDREEIFNNPQDWIFDKGNLRKQTEKEKLKYQEYLSKLGG